MTGLIVAFDDPDLDAAEGLAKELAGKVDAFKIGLTLYAACGPEAIDRISKYGQVFCDVKFHDIPKQVEGAARELATHDVWMFTVHASGGPAMIEAAVAAAPIPIVAGVTVLTSLTAVDLDRVGQGKDSATQATRLARLAIDSGARAVVCSGLEIKTVREEIGDEVLIVVPGIRPEGFGSQDQARVITPSQAAGEGADYIVVGRPISEASDPAAMAKDIYSQMRS